ncbi:PE domain-containing protein [Pseudonocardia hispaniensis]|uniref:PE domain-containing protein n=1 Tax=Pseudonocardia hispaniensis TaxID=904933 RepID=A0ABW1J9G6_9PSEU
MGPVRGRAAQRRVLVALATPDAGPVATGTLVVDPERAQRCIEELGQIVEDLRMAALPALRHAHFEAPSNDEVSVNMTRNAAEMTRRASAYVETWANQIDATRQALRQQLEAYVQAEQANRADRA